MAPDVERLRDAAEPDGAGQQDAVAAPPGAARLLDGIAAQRPGGVLPAEPHVRLSADEPRRAARHVLPAAQRCEPSRLHGEARPERPDAVFQLALAAHYVVRPGGQSLVGPKPAPGPMDEADWAAQQSEFHVR